MTPENMKLVKIFLSIIVVGIIIVYVIMIAVKQSKNGIETDKKTYFTEGIAVGIALSTGVGASFGMENIPFGIAAACFWEWQLA